MLFDENYKLTKLRNSTNPKHKKHTHKNHIKEHSHTAQNR